MSKIEFLDPYEAEKFKKQKCDVFCWTPCNIFATLYRTKTILLLSQLNQIFPKMHDFVLFLLTFFQQNLGI